MKNIIVGTAGHIDHGKTALVKALTGIDADRLEEEKRRGITIDLGFAHLQLTPELRLGFVDVPGHERFVKNMLAGVGGIDLVLFVVAADESIKPQTREHFDICRLLGIPRGIIALTKADLVDPDMVGLVRLEVEELVGGLFSGRRADRGGELDTGRASTICGGNLERMAARRAPRRTRRDISACPSTGRFRVKGFGTVVTGTLISGAVRQGAGGGAVSRGPAAARARRAGPWTPAGRGVAGQRTALNLADIEPAELARGDVLAEPGRFPRGDDRSIAGWICCAPRSPEASRAGPFPRRHGGDRSRGADARQAPRRCKPGSTRLMRASCCANRRCCCPATASSSACFRRSVTIGGRRSGGYRRAAVSQEGRCRAARLDDAVLAGRLYAHRAAGARTPSGCRSRNWWRGRA